jgi:hypothetical protein
MMLNPKLTTGELADLLKGGSVLLGIQDPHSVDTFVGALRKAPDEEDRPYYMVHLAEVAWMLSDAGADDELVAAGWLHDVLEDCGYTARQLEQEIDNQRVATLVRWVSETGNAPLPEGEKEPWEVRNHRYLKRMQDRAEAIRAMIEIHGGGVDLVKVQQYLDILDQLRRFAG